MLDILAFGAHPDDTELGCSGTLATLVNQGVKVGVIDLTRGEMGSRGSAELRLKEAQAASDILGLHIRKTWDFRILNWKTIEIINYLLSK